MTDEIANKDKKKEYNRKYLEKKKQKSSYVKKPKGRRPTYTPEERKLKNKERNKKYYEKLKNNKIELILDDSEENPKVRIKSFSTNMDKIKDQLMTYFKQNNIILSDKKEEEIQKVEEIEKVESLNFDNNYLISQFTDTQTNNFEENICSDYKNEENIDTLSEKNKISPKIQKIIDQINSTNSDNVKITSCSTDKVKEKNKKIKNCLRKDPCYYCLRKCLDRCDRFDIMSDCYEENDLILCRQCGQKSKDNIHCH